MITINMQWHQLVRFALFPCSPEPPGWAAREKAGYRAAPGRKGKGGEGAVKKEFQVGICGTTLSSPGRVEWEEVAGMGAWRFSWS